MKLSFHLDGRLVELDVPPLQRLCDALSDLLALDGHVFDDASCDGESAGRCLVLLDGEPAPSCVVPMIQIDGSQVRTARALRDEPVLAPLVSSLADAAICDACADAVVIVGAYVAGSEALTGDAAAFASDKLLPSGPALCGCDLTALRAALDRLRLARAQAASRPSATADARSVARVSVPAKPTRAKRTSRGSVGVRPRVSARSAGGRRTTSTRYSSERPAGRPKSPGSRGRTRGRR